MGCLTALTILSILVWLLGLGMAGYMSPTTIAVTMVLLVIAVALGRRFGAREKAGAAQAGCITQTFRVGVPIASLLTFCAIYGQGSLRGFTSVLLGLAQLCILLFGIYVMVRGPWWR